MAVTQMRQQLLLPGEEEKVLNQHFWLWIPKEETSHRWRGCIAKVRCVVRQCSKGCRTLCLVGSPGLEHCLVHRKC